MQVSERHPIEHPSETLEYAHADFQTYIDSIGIDSLLATLPDTEDIGLTKYADERIDCIIVDEETLQRLARRAGIKPTVRHSLFAHYEDVVDMAVGLPANQSVLVVDKDVVSGYDE